MGGGSFLYAPEVHVFSHKPSTQSFHYLSTVTEGMQNMQNSPKRLPDQIKICYPYLGCPWRHKYALMVRNQRAKSTCLAKVCIHTDLELEKRTPSCHQSKNVSRNRYGHRGMQNRKRQSFFRIAACLADKENAVHHKMETQLPQTSRFIFNFHVRGNRGGFIPARKGRTNRFSLSFQRIE